MRLSPTLAGLLVLLCAATVGCTRAKQQDPTPPPEAPPQKKLGPSPIRRLTHTEYDNVVADLLGDTTHPARGFEPEEIVGGFKNNADTLTVSGPLTEQYLNAAQALADRADLSKLLGCDPAVSGEDACAKSFIASFGLRAFRRPLTDEEKMQWFTLYQTDRAAESFEPAVRLVIEGMLVSPNFLYRAESGGDGAPGEIVPLTQYEIASRLSFFLWATMPDDELFQAAAEGRLSSPDELEKQAKRLLADLRARPVVSSFHQMWLGIDSDDAPFKEPTLYSSFPTAWPLLRQETELFVTDIFWTGHDASELFTARYSFMNRQLGVFYGRSDGDLPAGDDFEKVDLSKYTRVGLLTQGSVLSVASTAEDSSPTQRGKFIRERLLCQTLPPPPNAAAAVLKAADPNATTRQRYLVHSQDPACSGCHALMDATGFAFENFDAAGLYRYADHGQTVDASGSLLLNDGAHAFNGPFELSSLLAQSPEVKQCIARQWFRFAFGRHETPEDDESLTSVDGAFEQAHFDLKSIVVAIVRSDAFRYRKKPEVSP